MVRMWVVLVALGASKLVFDVVVVIKVTTAGNSVVMDGGVDYDYGCD